MRDREATIWIGLGIVVVALVVVLVGPYFAGYHRGYGSVTDALSGEHCIRWVGAVWCQS